MGQSSIRKSFKSAGVLDKDYDVALPSHDVDPFLEADAQMELEGLMERAVPVRDVVFRNILKVMTA